jgi:hypothetical protein
VGSLSLLSTTAAVRRFLQFKVHHGDSQAALIKADHIHARVAALRHVRAAKAFVLEVPP